MPYSLILASQSPYRKSLLERLPIPFNCISPEIDESTFKQNHQTPQEIAESLALAKAEKVFQENPNACVIGGDQIAHIDGQRLDKPKTPEKALAQLILLSGKTHQLITSIAVISPRGVKVFSDITSLTMRSLNISQLEQYIKRDQPLDCAGSYKIEDSGITLFQSINSQDQSAIMGIPLIKLSETLIHIGYQIP